MKKKIILNFYDIFNIVCVDIAEHILNFHICSFMTAIDKLCYYIIYTITLYIFNFFCFFFVKRLWIFKISFIDLSCFTNTRCRKKLSRNEEIENMITFWDILDRYAN